MSKLIFLDIDGTLIDFHQQMPASAKQALKLAQEHGHKIVLCTGRTYSNIYPSLLEMDFDAVVASTGAYIVAGKKVIYHHVLDPQKLKQMEGLMNAHHAYYMMQGIEAGYMDQSSARRMKQYFASMGINTDAGFKHIILTDHPLHQPLLESGVYYEADIGIHQMQQEMDQKTDRYFTIAGASFGTEREYCGEITCKGIHKGTGMLRLAQYMGIGQEDIIGIGDGPNDFDMIRTAAVGIVMGNGVEELKAEADYVTDPIDRDGIWNAFVHYGLI